MSAEEPLVLLIRHDFGGLGYILALGFFQLIVARAFEGTSLSRKAKILVSIFGNINLTHRLLLHALR